MAEFDALIFDCDGVLVDSEVLAIAAERDVLARVGLIYDTVEFVSRFVGLTDAAFHAALKWDALERTGKALPEDIGIQLTTARWKLFEAELSAIAGARELAEAWRGPKAVASSSGPEKLVRKFALTGLTGLFEPHVYSGRSVPNGKPAPDLFLMTAGKLAALPERCVVIEDSLNGVRAGVAAGMHVIGFTGGGHADAELGQRLCATGAHQVFDSHEEIAAYLRLG